MADVEVPSLLSVAQAMSIIDSVAVRPRVERKSLREASGKRLAADLVADRDYPPFRKSLMDGFAVRVQDVGTAGAGAPVRLAVVGEVAAGAWPGKRVGAGEAMAIMTGAAVPEGADAVVPVEMTQSVVDQQVEIGSAVRAGQNIAGQGSDCPSGQLVLSRGMRLGPAQMAVACTIGAAEVEVFAAPRVAVLGTGDELVEVGVELAAGQIRNSNSAMLMSLLGQFGCERTDLGVARDDPDLIRAAIREGLSYDVLFVTGGMSMGRHDHVPRILGELGVELKISKLRIKPGKPFVFGVHGGGFVFGLPGNPVSAFVCTYRLASRLLARLGGGVASEAWVSGILDQGLAANGAREFYQPAIRTVRPGASSARSEFAQITPLSWKGSADLFTLARANVLIVRGEQEPPLARGTLVRVLELPGDGGD